MGSVIAVGFALYYIAALSASIKRVHWAVTLLLIVVSLPFTFYVAHKLSDFEGWPTGQALPDGARFLHAEVREPYQDDPGAIYVLVATETEPRLYVLPYSRPLHEQTHRASERAKRGERVAVKGSRKGRGDKSPVRFYVLPPPGADTKQ
jgi:hypothetical protein